MTDLSLPCLAEELIPHRLPMRLVERLLSVEGKNGVVEARVAVGGLFSDASGMLEELALVEIIAQSYAALKGYIDRRDQVPVRQGFLVGVRKIDCYAPVRKDDLLRVQVRTLAEFNDFAIAEGEIHCGEVLVAGGDVKVWIQ